MAKQPVKPTPAKSRAPFFIVVLAVIVAGAAGIFYTINNKPKPIVLAPGTKLPEAAGYLRGNPDAPVTIMEFADFECPGCGQFATITEPDVRTRIIDAGLANFRFFDFPLTQIHANTMSASLAAACANEQGKFWEMHDALFAGQHEWNGQATTNPKKVFSGYVSKLGLDGDKWNSCFDSQKFVPQIEANRNAGLERQVGSTPTFVINNTVYAQGLSYDQIKGIVDSLSAAKAAAAKPADAKPAEKK